MTEQEWLDSDRVLTPLMNWLRERGTNRQFYLAAAGWVRQVEDKLSGERYRELILLAEGFADGTVAADVLVRQSREAEDLIPVVARGLEREGLNPRAAIKRMSANYAAVRAATPPDGWIAAINALKDAGNAGKRSETGPRQTSLLRDIFGNPFRPVAFDPEWRTSNVVSLAKSMYESRDFGAMPILSDALQDAGCEQADILDHCRGSGPHVRGCWVVDWILGKA